LVIQALRHLGQRHIDVGIIVNGSCRENVHVRQWPLEI
jgi:hypothetical protein